jgi:uncharacterized membrane protein YgcG
MEWALGSVMVGLGLIFFAVWRRKRAWKASCTRYLEQERTRKECLQEGGITVPQAKHYEVYASSPYFCDSGVYDTLSSLCSPSSDYSSSDSSSGDSSSSGSDSSSDFSGGGGDSGGGGASGEW